jgi:hypothetical protein
MIDQSLEFESRMTACSKGFAPHIDHVRTEGSARERARRRITKALDDYRDRGGDEPMRRASLRGGDHYDPRLFYFRALLERDRNL